MFEYLASGKVIIASKMQVYKHILQNNYNSYLINRDIGSWIKELNCN